MSLFKKKEKIIPYLFSAKEAYKQYECERNNGRTQEEVQNFTVKLYQDVASAISNSIKEHQTKVNFTIYRSIAKEDYELYLHILKTDIVKDLKLLGFYVKCIPIPDNRYYTLIIDWSDSEIWKDY